MIKEKVVLVTHNDLDGVGCQIILKSICNYFDITVINCNYDKVDRVVKNLVTGSEHYDRLFITDISVRDSSVVELINNNTCFSHVVLLDHHETVEDLNNYSWATVKMIDDNNKRVCGTTLLLDYIYNNLFKTTILLVDIVVNFLLLNIENHLVGFIKDRVTKRQLFNH